MFFSYTILCSNFKADEGAFRFVVLKTETMRMMIHKAGFSSISWQWCRWCIPEHVDITSATNIQSHLATSLHITLLNVSNVTKHMPQHSRFRTVVDYFQRDFHLKAALHKHLGLVTELLSVWQLFAGAWSYLMWGFTVMTTSEEISI